MKLTPDSFFYNTTFPREKVLSLIDKASNPQAFRAYISETIIKSDKKDPKYNEFREEIYLKIIGNAFKLGHSLQFSIEKFSALFSILDFVFNESLDQKMSSLDSYAMLKKIISRHLYQCEPYSIGIFNEKEHQEILKFMRDDFFRYFSLYEISLTKFVDYNIFTSSPEEEDWPVGFYCELDQGETAEPALVDVLEEYFVEEKLKSEGDEEKSEENQQELNENKVENRCADEISKRKIAVLSEEMKRIEAETQKSIGEAREIIGKRMEIAEKTIKEQAEDLINPKKKKP